MWTFFSLKYVLRKITYFLLRAAESEMKTPSTSRLFSHLRHTRGEFWTLGKSTLVLRERHCHEGEERKVEVFALKRIEARTRKKKKERKKERITMSNRVYQRVWQETSSKRERVFHSHNTDHIHGRVTSSLLFYTFRAIHNLSLFLR